MKKTFALFFVILFSLISCGQTAGTGAESSDDSGNSGAAGNSDLTDVGELGAELSGRVTYYTGYDESSVAYYVPEIEDGWYKCAVSEYKYSQYPAGTALELSYNGKTINALVTDLCPYGDNVSNVSDENFYFDLGQNAFQNLIGDLTVGTTNVTFKSVPYPTKKNIYFQAKDGINEWWFAGRFYNLRYPLKKVEISTDGGNTFVEMNPLSGIENNWYLVESSSGGLCKEDVFRLTDVYGHVIVSGSVKSISENGKYDLGKNFEY